MCVMEEQLLVIIPPLACHIWATSNIRFRNEWVQVRSVTGWVETCFFWNETGKLVGRQERAE